VYTFPLGFYGPAVVPLVIAYLVTTVETVGDISASFEASQLDTTGDFYSTSLQGGLTSDGFGSILAGLFTSMPNTTFSQNNGVISLTKCASRRAGFGAAFWMIVLGVFGKFAGTYFQDGFHHEEYLLRHGPLTRHALDVLFIFFD
jgi:NCS2 family nucleobase:cation symporter-2